MDYTERVEGFQIRDVVYFGKPPKDAPIKYDIVKWCQHDRPFMAHVFENGMDCGEKEITESCYSVAFLEWDAHDACFELRSVGMRFVEAKPSEAVMDLILDFCKSHQEVDEDG